MSKEIQTDLLTYIERVYCDFCLHSYRSKESMEGHRQANHWKRLRPLQHGRSGQ